MKESFDPNFPFSGLVYLISVLVSTSFVPFVHVLSFKICNQHKDQIPLCALIFSHTMNSCHEMIFRLLSSYSRAESSILLPNHANTAHVLSFVLYISTILNPLLHISCNESSTQMTPTVSNNMSLELSLSRPWN